MVVPKWISLPDKCPKCGGFVHHVNAVDLCGLYFVYCSTRVVTVSCRWCRLLDFRE